MSLDVLYHDNHLLVVAKPAGRLVQADETGDLDLLTEAKDWVARTWAKPGRAFLGLVHRLDRPVSGVLLFARTSKAAARLSDQFRRHTPEKRYIALVEGALRGAGSAVHHLVKEDRTVRTVAPGHPGAKEARLAWRALATRAGRTLVEVRLETGRAHQIRVQLAALGHPIVGDLRYGATSEFDGRNLALHAISLAVEHPVRRERIEWTAPVPASWGDWRNIPV